MSIVKRLGEDWRCNYTNNHWEYKLFGKKNQAKVEFLDIFIFINVKSDLKIILFLPNQVVFKVKVLPLQRLYPYRKPRWAEVGQTYIHIRRNCTLWFWQCKNLAVRAKLSRTKQRERLMRCIVYSPYWLRTILSFVVKSAFYIRTQAWGFRRCISVVHWKTTILICYLLDYQ